VISRERRRLDRAFQAVLMALGSPAIVVACGSSGAEHAAAVDGGGTSPLDATIAHDATDSVDATESGSAPVREAGSTSASDAGDAHTPVTVKDAGAALSDGPSNGCYSNAYELDAGPDADAMSDICAFVYLCGLEGTGLANVGCQIWQADPAVDGGAVPIPQMSCWLPQGLGCDEDAYAPGEGGALTIYCSPCPASGGRRPAGLLNAAEAPRGAAFAEYLASMAFEEDAAIAAFERMRAELSSLGAPASLVNAASKAARDEVRHARVMATLARRAGRVAIVRARVRRRARRSASAIAAENAAEGCVRETYGALVAAWQAQRAEDPAARAAFGRIAKDEAGHAALSWAVARWLEPRLDSAARGRVARARRNAIVALERTARVEPARELARAAGLPSARDAQALLAGMVRELGLRAA